MHGKRAGLLRCVRESPRAVMCFYVAAGRGAGSVGLAGDEAAHAGLMPGEAPLRVREGCGELLSVLSPSIKWPF